MTIAAGEALYDSSRIQSDAFVGAGILLMLLFVTLFITVPLFMVMRSTIWIDAAFTLAQFGTTFSSSLFLLVNNPYAEVAEGSRVGVVTVIGLAAGLGLGMRQSMHQSPWRRVAVVVVCALIGALAGWALGIMIWGRGGCHPSRWY